MSLICPECERPYLKVTKSVDIAPDDKWDEIAVQTIKCSSCGFEGIAVYRESRRGPMGQELVHHIGYKADKGTIAKVKKDLQSKRVKAPEKYTEGIDWKSQFGIRFVR